MSSLEMKTRHGDDRRALFRRHHDLSGVDRVHIALLPAEGADAIMRGGVLRVTLREDAGPEQASCGGGGSGPDLARRVSVRPGA